MIRAATSVLHVPFAQAGRAALIVPRGSGVSSRRAYCQGQMDLTTPPQRRHTPSPSIVPTRRGWRRTIRDAENLVGTAFQDHIGLESPAWDVWMLFAPGVVWEGDLPPEPTWWEHQLGGLNPDLKLDPDRFARKAVELSEVSD